VPGVEALIDAVLVLDHGRPFQLTPLADGFRLEGGIDGEPGWFRHWPPRYRNRTWISSATCGGLRRLELSEQVG
jgi:hypothetical protein